jgi:catechol 2,3-dioxygenase-like lactoylglutathione lyase family enzyme
MLGKSQLTTIVPVVDLERAQKFYEGRLGVGPGERVADGGLRYRTGGGGFVLSPRQEPVRNPYTMMTFEVRDVEKEVKDLEGRGVAFEDYDLPNLKTVGHVCVMGSEKAAWFKDPEGNILCVHEDSKTRH